MYYPYLIGVQVRMAVAHVDAREMRAQGAGRRGARAGYPAALQQLLAAFHLKVI